MIDALKDYLAPKRFGVVAYVWLIVHFLCGLVLISVTWVLRASEIGKFSCVVDTKSTAVYKTYVEKTCHSRYKQTYNSPLPLYGFVLLSIGLTVLVSVIYSLAVSSRIDKIDNRVLNGTEEATTNNEETSHGFYGFCFYFFHLIARSVFGIVFTVLQHTVLYPSGFDSEFSCTLPVTSKIAKNSSVALSNVTSSITCENSTAPEKELWAIIVSVLNTVFALIVFGEVIYLWRRFPLLNCRTQVNWSCGTEFVTVYLLHKRYTPVGVELTSTECIEFYKQQVSQQSLSPDINYASTTSLDDMYIDVVIHTGRAQHPFLRKMDRHEIYDVYMKVPLSSICLEKIKDLFYPNKDTKNKFPRTILAVGRPGIGKTVLTEKIIHDWANGIDEFYHGKIVFFFKFGWFNFEELKDMSLKTFLRHGTGGLDAEKFDIIFEQILRLPKKVVFIFDGFDEFYGDFDKCLDESRTLPNDPNTFMSPMTLFVKLVYNKMLSGSTILLTSRPAAVLLFSTGYFDRTVEMIGFTSDKIEDYVGKFCENIDKSYLKPKIWNHIKSSDDLLNLCYIPVNSYIVCMTLSGCLSSSDNRTGALPTTLTALYQTALDYFAKYHDRNVHDACSDEMLEKLQEKAFHGMENGQLVFNEKQLDEQMRVSGLVNSFINPIRPLQTQFCFIHLTIQEFLAAKNVVETLQPDEIGTFISTHIKSGQWHLALQFIAGLLGEKIKMSGSGEQDCVFAFAKCLPSHGVISLDGNSDLVVLKCLREVDDEGIVKKVCEKTDLNDVRTLLLWWGGIGLSSSDWAAIAFVCKHLNSVVHLRFYINEALTLKSNYHLVLSKLVQERCFETLYLKREFVRDANDIVNEYLIRALTESKCSLNHEHAKLRKLEHESLGMSEAHVSNICTLVKNGHARHLQVLNLRENRITSRGITELSEVLNDELCGELTNLDLSGNVIGYEDVGMLCHALIPGRCKIDTLVPSICSTTAICVRRLSEVLRDEDCKLLTDLSLGGNEIGDEGVRMLCTNALGNEHCKLTRLYLGSCSLTAKCIRWLSEVLCGEHCKLTVLSLDNNNIGNKGVRMLCIDALRRDQCKLTKLSLSWCGLTDQCVPLLCETLQDRNCRLKRLSIRGNRFSKRNMNLLLDLQKIEICEARNLVIDVDKYGWDVL